MHCQSLLQGIFLTQGWILCLLHWQVDSLLLSHQGNPYISLHSTKQTSLCYKVGFMNYLLYIQQCEYVNSNFLIYPSSITPLVNISLFCISVTQFLFYKQVHLNAFFRSHIYAMSSNICLSLTYFTQNENLQVHLCCWKWHYFILFCG